MFEFLKIDFRLNIALFLIMILFFNTLVLLLKNQKLTQELNNLKTLNNTLIRKKIIENPSKEKVKEKKIAKLEKEKKDQEVLNNMNKEVEIKKETKSIDSLEKQPINKVKINNKITSPIQLENESISPKLAKSTFNLNEYIKKSNHNINQNNHPTTKNNKDYLKEISDKMARELHPQTIELTDYEKEQEENAIISYQELLAFKDKITKEESEALEFIEELKNFRNSLN